MIKFKMPNKQLLVGLTIMAVGLLHSTCAHAKDVRVMVIDTGISQHIDLIRYLQPGNYDDQDDTYGHGTHVAGIIAESNCPNLKIVSCKFYFNKAGVMLRLMDCLDRATKEHIDIVNFSGGGKDFDQKEYEAYKKINNLGIKIVVSAGNDSKNLGSPCYGYFPACYRLSNMTEVGAFDSAPINGQGYAGFKWNRSNYGIPGMQWEQGVDVLSTLPGNKYGKMSGTSQAAAMATKHLVEEMCYK